MSEQLLIKTFTTEEAIEKNRLVSINSDKIRLATATRKAIGVNCSYNVKTNERVDIGMIGIFDVEASASINAGASITATSEGRALTHSSSGTSDKVGIAITSASRSGDLLRVLLLPQ